MLNMFVCLLDSRVKEKIVIPLICMIFHFQLLQQMSNPTPEIPGVGKIHKYANVLCKNVAKSMF